MFLLVAACSSRSTTVIVDLPVANGIASGTPVRFHGMDIGHVRSITPTRDGVRIQLSIDRQDAPVRTADRVAVQPEGIFGAYVIAIVPGPDSAPVVRDQATLAAAPPDSLAPIRDAIARAVAKEAIDQFQHRDSAQRTRRAPLPSRP